MYLSLMNEQTATNNDVCFLGSHRGGWDAAYVRFFLFMPPKELWEAYILTGYKNATRTSSYVFQVVEC